MKFTLKLTDYIDQYQVNLDKDSIVCPVCYCEVMSGNITEDVSHLLSCYKDQVIELKLIEHMDQTGVVPDIDEFWVNSIIEQVEREVIQCSSKL